jgi:hypothetical protein
MSDLTVMTESLEAGGRGRRRGRHGDSGALDLGAGNSRLRALTDPASLLPTYAGVLIALIGFALIGIAWAKVAGLVDVWKQMPYLLSAGLPGLGLVMTGLVVINISARRQDGAARARQMETLTEALRDLQQSLDK